MDKSFIGSVLKQYYFACDVLANNFANKYFGKDAECWWVADEIGGVYYINDYWFSVSEMADFVKYKYTRKEMFGYKNQQTECYESKKCTMLCIRDWKKINKMKLK